MKDEIRGIFRVYYCLLFWVDDDFVFNELFMIFSVFDSFFGIFNLVGIVIGLFVMLVGIVSVVNIMFVFVKECINLIGVKKVLGVKCIVILLEFLIEFVVFCFIGGLAGFGLIYVIIMMFFNIIDFDMYLFFGNMVLGVVVFVLVGVVFGLIFVIQAFCMDLVEVMWQ